MKASKHEADSLPSQAESYLMRIKSKISEQGSGSCYDNDTGMSHMELDDYFSARSGNSFLYTVLTLMSPLHSLLFNY